MIIPWFINKYKKILEVSHNKQLLSKIDHDYIFQDGGEKWQRWEELVHLLWMLLLSYNKAMEGEILVNHDDVWFPIPSNTISKLIISLINSINARQWQCQFGWKWLNK